MGPKGHENYKMGGYSLIPIKDALQVGVYGGRVIGQTNASDGSWRHVAAVLPDGEDNADDILLYLDGQLDGNGPAPVSYTIDTDNVNGSDLRVGMLNWVGHENYFDGLIDDVRLYSCDLSDAQIASLGAYHRQGFTYDKLGNRLTLSVARVSCPRAELRRPETLPAIPAKAGIQDVRQPLPCYPTHPPSPHLDAPLDILTHHTSVPPPPPAPDVKSTDSFH